MKTETQIFANSLMNSQIEKAMWKELSSEEPLTVRFLRQNKTKLNWKAVSENYHISWNIDMLKEFSGLLSWKKVTDIMFNSWYEPGISPEKMRIEELLNFIEEFKECWDWDVLSSEISHTQIEDVLDKYASKLNWSNIVENRHIEWTSQMATKYEKYISEVRDIERSCMWSTLSKNLVVDLKRSLMNE